MTEAGPVSEGREQALRVRLPPSRGPGSRLEGGQDIQAIYIQHLEAIYGRCPRDLLERIRRLTTDAAPRVAADFLATLREVEGTETYLGTAGVQEHILSGLAAWLKVLFIFREGDEIKAYISRQMELGVLHARIDLPLHLLNTGTRILKQRIHHELMEHVEDLKEYYRLETIADMLLDVTVSLMGECYLSDRVDDDKQLQSLKFHISGQELALRCERMRTHAFAWQARLLGLLYRKPELSLQQLPTISRSSVGLWVSHKAPILFAESEQLVELTTVLKRIDEAVMEIVRNRRHGGDDSGLSEGVERIAERVQALSSLLDLLADHALAMDSGRDPLTRLLTRRFLDPILQRETRFCLRHQRSYVLMMADIDHFKAINDEYGHSAGDQVLSQLAELLVNTLRDGDFVFRYGGEEFLLLLPEINASKAAKLADKLLDAVRQSRFEIGLGQQVLQVTISLGLASFDGTRNYQRTIELADQALYRAKRTGRDRYCVAGWDQDPG